MSTVKATNLQHESATSPNITLGSDGSVAVGGGNISPQTGFRNRIINGDMRIDQRNGGAAVTPTESSYTLDRWQFGTTVASKCSVQRNAGAVTPPSGFSNYLGVTSVSAYTLNTGDRIGLFQNIEGFNTADLAWGTANAQPITISFWVRSSLTGAFGGTAANAAYNRGYVYSYTINAANTWEYKTITIPGDTTGVWQTDSSTGLAISWAVAVHSGLQGAPGAWSSTVSFAPAGQVNLAGTNGATFYITGVQLEKGSVATPFEFRNIGQELALCQRYCLFLGNYGAGGVLTLARGFSTGGTSGWRIGVETPVSLRAAPTITPVNLTGWSPQVSPTSFTGISGVYSTQGNNLEFDATFANNTGSIGSLWAVQTNTGSASYLLVSAEL